MNFTQFMAHFGSFCWILAFSVCGILLAKTITESIASETKSRTLVSEIVCPFATLFVGLSIGYFLKANHACCVCCEEPDELQEVVVQPAAVESLPVEETQPVEMTEMAARDLAVERAVEQAVATERAEVDARTLAAEHTRATAIAESRERKRSFFKSVKIVLDFLTIFGAVIFEVLFPLDPTPSGDLAPTPSNHKNPWPRKSTCLVIFAGATISTTFGFVFRRGPIEGFLTLTTATLPVLTFLATERRWVMCGFVGGLFLAVALAVCFSYLYLWKRSWGWLLFLICAYFILVCGFIFVFAFYGGRLLAADKKM